MENYSDVYDYDAHAEAKTIYNKAVGIAQAAYDKAIIDAKKDYDKIADAAFAAYTEAEVAIHTLNKDK